MPHPFFHSLYVGIRERLAYNVPPGLGSSTQVPAGFSWEFFKPVYAGDSFKVKADTSLLIEDITRLDGTARYQLS